MSKVILSRSWNQMKGCAKKQYKYIRYESPNTNQSKVMTQVKVLKMKVKLPRSKLRSMVSNEKSCQKNDTSEI